MLTSNLINYLSRISAYLLLQPKRKNFSPIPGISFPGRAVGFHPPQRLSPSLYFHGNKNQELSKQLTRSISRKAKQDRILTLKKIMSYQNDHDLDSFEPTIIHGESVVDRKSVFQGHCAAISCVEHVDIFLSKLKENKKIENAFHNMWAYRVDKSDPEARQAGKSASIIQDCDDDGEQAAGGRLLSLLQILNVVNVMVVVTRWYGGIQLGPARFKHINNAARDALVKGGFVNDGGGEGTSQEKSKSGGRGKAGGKKKGK